MRLVDKRLGLAAKRALDASVSFVLMVLGLPLMILLAIAIKIDSQGPVLFTQAREGWRDTVFQIYKFRSMVQGANEDGPIANLGDVRVTRLGRFLRKTSLDELPQLFNVLKGDMSLVGPRPLLPGTTRPEEMRRLEMRPGMTGLVEVSSPHLLDWDQRMALDVRYIERWSLRLDMSILLRTIPVMLARKDALDPPREDAA